MEIILTDHLSVLVKTQDILAMMSVKNPLLASIRAMMGDGDTMQNVLQNPKTFAEFTNALNELLCDVIIAPPLIENGAEDGVSINQLTMDWKLKIFYALVGGKGTLEQAETFRDGQGTGVVDREAG
ncbi:MAG: hypothetical protein D6698_16315 [Gammaproteobacteria bacterium]|nr:MAG: hypothetical protein D6698_16315 [Gammaproteobacteria bacterium]